MSTTSTTPEASQNARQRRTFTPEQKLAVLRELLLGGKSISQLCLVHSIVPTMVYQWQKQLFDNGASAFGERRPSPKSPLKTPLKEESKIARLEHKLQLKDAVIGDIMIELMAVKKSLGEN